MTTGYSYKSCHTGSIKVFTGSNIEVYAGGRSHSPSYNHMDLIVDLTGSLSFTLWPIPKEWTAYKHMLQPNILKLSISDGSSPWHVDMDFWQALWQDFLNLAKEKTTNQPYKLLIVCQGGHGRTGTVLTALALAAGVTDTNKERGDVLACLRDIYCDEIVETTDQLEYLTEVCGLVTKEKHSRATKVTTYMPTAANQTNTGGKKNVGDSIPPALKGGQLGGWCNGKDGQDKVCLLKPNHLGSCLTNRDNLTWDEYCAKEKENDKKKGGDGNNSNTAVTPLLQQVDPSTGRLSFGRTGLDGHFYTWEDLKTMPDEIYSKLFSMSVVDNTDNHLYI